MSSAYATYAPDKKTNESVHREMGSVTKPNPAN